MTIVHGYAEVHTSIKKQVEDHVDLFWYGGFKRRIDCCHRLAIPFKSDVERAIAQLERAEADARPKRLSAIYGEVRELLVEAHGLLKKTEVLNFIDMFETLFYYVAKQGAEAQTEYYYTATVDRRKGKAAAATWDAWGQCWNILDGVSSLEIPEEELVELRSTRLRQGVGTLYDVFLLWLHHGKDYGAVPAYEQIDALLPQLYKKRRPHAFETLLERAYTDVILFVQNCMRKIDGLPAPYLIKEALDRFLPEIRYASDLLAQEIEENKEYNTVLVNEGSWALGHLWSTALAKIDVPLEMNPCNVIQLAYN